MRPLSSSSLLRVWEEGQSEPSYRQALLLLAAACPEQSLSDLANMSIGRRDACLLTLREWTFGPRLVCVVSCPACGEHLEFNVSVSDLRVEVPELENEDLHLVLDGYDVDFRLPCTVDLSEASGFDDKESLRSAIIRRCIQGIHHQGEAMAPGKAPAHVVEAVIASMGEHDPQADMQLSIRCSGCNHQWRALFDIVSYFWAEIQVWAMRILREVHTIAFAYGWGEADILAMGALRRQHYLQMIGA